MPNLMQILSIILKLQAVKQSGPGFFGLPCIVTMAPSRVVSEIFNVEKYRNLEIRVRGHSRSLKVVPFDRLAIVCSIVTLFLRPKFLRHSTCKYTVGALKTREWTTREWTRRHDETGVDHAGVDNAGVAKHEQRSNPVTPQRSLFEHRSPE